MNTIRANAITASIAVALGSAGCVAGPMRIFHEPSGEAEAMGARLKERLAGKNPYPWQACSVPNRTQANYMMQASGASAVRMQHHMEDGTRYAIYGDGVLKYGSAEIGMEQVYDFHVGLFGAEIAIDRLGKLVKGRPDCVTVQDVKFLAWIMAGSPPFFSEASVFSRQQKMAEKVINDILCESRISGEIKQAVKDARINQVNHFFDPWCRENFGPIL